MARWKLPLLVGVIVLAAGVVVTAIPLVPVPSGDKTVGEGNFAFFQVNSILLPQGISVSWKAANATTLWIQDCGSDQPTSTGFAPCPQSSSTPVTETGTSGTFSLTAKGGDWIAIGTEGNNASITLKTTDSQGALGVYLLGAVLLLFAWRSYRLEKRGGQGDTTAKGSSAEEPDTGPAASAPTAPKETEDASPKAAAEPSSSPQGEGTAVVEASNDEGTR